MSDDFVSSSYGLPQNQKTQSDMLGRPTIHPDSKRGQTSSIRFPHVIHDVIEGMSFIYGENCKFKTTGRILSYLREMFLYMIDNGDYELLNLNPTDYSKIDFFYKKRLCSNYALGFEKNHPPYRVVAGSLSFSNNDIAKFEEYRGLMGSQEGKTTPTILNMPSEHMQHALFFAKMVEVYLHHVVMGLLPKEHENERYTQRYNCFDPSFDLEAKLQAIQACCALATPK